MGEVRGAAPSEDAIVVTYRDRSITFEAFGGPMERLLREGSFYEQQLLHYIESLQLGGAYVDVGALIGTHTLFFAGYCPASRIYSFEPRRRYHDCMQRHVQRNGFAERVELHAFGVSDREESVEVKLDRKREILDCKPLDQVIAEPVSLMKIDVEGMEGKVLMGAARILRESKPLLFIESHSREELDRHAALLAPYGYEPTGRAFNWSPTYELAARDSPTAPSTLLPRALPLIDAALWSSRDSRLDCTVDGGRLRVRSQLPRRAGARVTQYHLRRLGPAGDALRVSSSSTYFLEAVSEVSKGTRVRFVVIEHGLLHRRKHRIHFQSRLFQRLDLRASTRRIRVAIVLEGPGEVTFERIALHQLGPRPPRPTEPDRASSGAPGSAR